MFKIIKKLGIGLSTTLAMSLLTFAPAVNAAASTITVTPSNNQGWSFNPDPTTTTPYEFNEDQSSLSDGSLYVQPIANDYSGTACKGGLDQTGCNKFIAVKTLATPVADVSNLSYDFLIAGTGDSSDANQFYLNVYTNLSGSSTFYDCRFDYVPSTGSTATFTTASFDATDTPINVGDRTAGGDTFDCPNTLAEMPSGSTVSFIAVNVGDTSNSDTGIAGHLDKVVVTTASDEVTYDFEQDPVTLANKDECKKGGWMTSEAPVFKNQGDCVSHFASQGRANGNPVLNLLRRFF